MGPLDAYVVWRRTLTETMNLPSKWWRRIFAVVFAFVADTNGDVDMLPPYLVAVSALDVLRVCKEEVRCYKYYYDPKYRSTSCYHVRAGEYAIKFGRASTTCYQVQSI
jgi:hypothetical protein